MSSLRCRCQQGFTLTEVLVALTIFLITSLGLLPLLLGGMHAGQRNTLHSEARRLAGEALAALQVVDYSALPAFDGLPSSYGPIVVERRIESDTPEAGQTCLTVTAFWKAVGQGHSYQLQTIRSEP